MSRAVVARSAGRTTRFTARASGRSRRAFPSSSTCCRTVEASRAIATTRKGRAGDLSGVTPHGCQAAQAVLMQRAGWERCRRAGAPRPRREPRGGRGARLLPCQRESPRSMGQQTRADVIGRPASLLGPEDCAADCGDRRDRRDHGESSPLRAFEQMPAQEGSVDAGGLVVTVQEGLVCPPTSSSSQTSTSGDTRHEGDTTGPVEAGVQRGACAEVLGRDARRWAGRPQRGERSFDLRTRRAHSPCERRVIGARAPSPTVMA
jgi:hypothetical protein